MAASIFNKIMKEEATQLTGMTKKEPPALSTEDEEIKQLEDRRKELRKKENRSEKEKVEYTELNNAEKEAQTRLQKKRTDETIL